MNQSKKIIYVALFLACSLSSYLFLLKQGTRSSLHNLALQEQLDQKNSVEKFQNEDSKALTFPVIEVVKKVIQLIRLLPLN